MTRSDRKYETHAERQRAYRQRRREERALKLRAAIERLGGQVEPDWEPTASYWGQIGNNVKKAKAVHRREHTERRAGCPWCKF